MGNMFTITAENTSFTAAGTDFDVATLTPADDHPIWIMGWEIDDVSGQTVAGDTDEEFLRLSIQRGNTTAGSGGSTPTPVPIEPGDTANFTAHMMDTTIASGGSAVQVWAGGMNIRDVGPRFLGDAQHKEFCPKAAQAGGTASLLVLRMHTTVSQTMAVSVTVWVYEE